MIMRILIGMFAVLFLLIGLLLARESTVDGKSVEKQSFGVTADGSSVDLYVLTNRNGAQVSITNFGGVVVSIKMPDRKGTLGDIALGYDSLEGYINDKNFFGALIGRYGNRIAQGKFIINGVTYTLAKNNGENSLHGGTKGFNKVLWKAQGISKKDGPSLELKYS